MSAGDQIADGKAPQAGHVRVLQRQPARIRGAKLASSSPCCFWPDICWILSSHGNYTSFISPESAGLAGSTLHVGKVVPPPPDDASIPNMV